MRMVETDAQLRLEACRPGSGADLKKATSSCGWQKPDKPTMIPLQAFRCWSTSAKG